MRHLKTIALTASAALAMTAFVGAGTASATTIEKTGITQNSSVSISASLKSGTSTVMRDTFGFSVKTCTTSNIEWATESPFSSTTVTGAISTLTFGNCQKDVTVHKPGTLHIEHLAGTTNGRVSSSGAEITTFSAIHGTYINCTTGAGTVIGTLTGVKHGNATIDINATLTCSPHLHSKRWTGTYTVTTEGIGVSP